MFTINVEKFKDLAIVRCTGRIVRGENICRLKSELISANDTRLIVLDLSEVETIDAAGLSALVSLHHRSRSRGIQLKLVNPSRFVLEVLNRTKLSSVFDISSFHNALVAIAGASCSESRMRDGLAAALPAPVRVNA
jgi:anti-anti-sigma factor